MTVAGKTLTNAFYGRQPKYSYFSGCSTGGRQGINEARQYPSDYNGVLAGSPAINIPKQRVIGLWGELVMLQSNDFLPQCKFEAANAAAVQACDLLDKVKDGVINDPRDCNYDPQPLVGTSTACGTITQTDVNVIRKIWQGPKDTQGNFIWYFPDRGASFSGLSNTTTVGSTTVGAPSSLMTQWVQYALKQNPNWDWHTLTYQEFEHLFTQSVEEFGTVLSDSADLDSFHDAGGKLLMWHGWSDQLLSPRATINFYDRVTDATGSLKKTQDYARLFTAPGVGHCGGGNGPQPVGQFQALIDWVEHNDAPDTLRAEKRDATGNLIQTRPLCAYPQTAVYKGHGSTDDMKNFQCKTVDKDVKHQG
jgi:feruloyl esterase